MKPCFIVSVRTFTVLLVIPSVLAMLLFGAVVGAIVEIDKPRGSTILAAAIAADVAAALVVLFVLVCVGVRENALVCHGPGLVEE